MCLLVKQSKFPLSTFAVSCVICVVWQCAHTRTMNPTRPLCSGPCLPKAHHVEGKLVIQPVNERLLGMFHGQGCVREFTK